MGQTKPVKSKNNSLLLQTVQESLILSIILNLKETVPQTEAVPQRKQFPKGNSSPKETVPQRKQFPKGNSSSKGTNSPKGTVLLRKYKLNRVINSKLWKHFAAYSINIYAKPWNKSKPNTTRSVPV
jgi:hypothetical protein